MADKKLPVAQNMGLNEVEAKKFWPVYDTYKAELKIGLQHLSRTMPPNITTIP